MANTRSLFPNLDVPEPEHSVTGGALKSPTKKKMATMESNDDASTRAKSTPGQKKLTRKPAKVTKPRRLRTARPYPVVSFKEATQIGDAIFQFASGEKVRRLTLLEKMDRAPESSATKMLITNSGKYGITTGSYAAEFLELTTEGHAACDPSTAPAARLQARFRMSIAKIPPFSLLYEAYVGKKIPAHEVMKDKLDEGETKIEALTECVDLFVVNTKDLGLLRVIAGAETLISIDQALEEIGDSTRCPIANRPDYSQGR